MDATDPLVAAVAWALTAAARRIPWLERHRAVLPTVAVLAAVAVRAGVGAVQGEALTLDAVGRGVVAGALAVLAHSQARELAKLRAADAPAQ